MNNHEHMTPSISSNTEGPIKHVSVESSQRYLDREAIRDDIDFRKKMGEAGVRGETEATTARAKAKKALKGFLIAAGVLVVITGVLTIVGDKPDEIQKAYSDRGVKAIDGEKYIDRYHDAIEQAEAAAEQHSAKNTEAIMEKFNQNDNVFYDPNAPAEGTASPDTEADTAPTDEFLGGEEQN